MRDRFRSWKKSTFSNGTTAGCVEASRADDSSQRTDVVGIRDSKLPTVGEFPMLTVSGADWAGLLHSVRD